MAASGNGVQSVNFGIGSAAVNGLFRSVWTLGRVRGEDGKPTDVRAVAPSKTNLVPGDPNTILFELSRERGFLWAGVSDDVTAEQLYEPGRIPRRSADGGTALDEAVTLITDMLGENGYALRADIEKAAQAVGMRPRTLERAKGQLGLRSLLKGFGREKKGFWILPHINSDDIIGPPTQTSIIEFPGEWPPQ